MAVAEDSGVKEVEEMIGVPAATKIKVESGGLAVIGTDNTINININTIDIIQPSYIVNPNETVLDLITRTKTTYKTCLENWQRPYLEVDGERLTTECSWQQRLNEWVGVSLTEVNKERFGIMVQSPIDLNKIVKKDEEAKLNFLSGPPGVGKSSLLDYAVLSWAEGKFLNGENGCKFEVVQRFKCCDLARYCGKEITKEELFENNFGKKACASLLENVDPKDVLIILDGIDEFYAVDKLFTGKADDKMTFLVEDLIKPESVLSPGHYVLVSGRQYAIQMLEQKAAKIGSKGRLVEIKGFTSDGIEAFISKFSGVDKDLNSHITIRIEESLALRMCSKIPLFLHNICYILKAEKEQGKAFQLETVTDIYTMLLCLMIKFHCKIGSQDLSYMDLHALLKDKKIKRFLYKLTEIAWNLLQENREFLEEQEVQGLKSEDGFVQGLIEGFIVKIPNELEETFQFIHLNMQEYLAAIYCVKSKIDQGYLVDTRYVEVLKFMSGLTGAEVQPKREERKQSRMTAKPWKKLKSLILGDAKLEKSRIEFLFFFFVLFLFHFCLWYPG